MSEKNKDMEQMIQDSPYFTLDEQAKTRIHEQLMIEAEKQDKRKKQLTVWKRATIWLSSAAALVVFTIFTFSNLNSGGIHDEMAESEEAAIEDDADMEEESVSEGMEPGQDFSVEYNTIDQRDVEKVEEWQDQVIRDEQAVGLIEISDEKSNVWRAYAYSPTYNDAVIYQEGKFLKVIFRNSEVGESDDILVKIDYRTDVFEGFSLEEEGMDQTNKATHDKNIDDVYIIESLTQGMEKIEVEQLFDNNYTEVVSAKDGTNMWRYDFGLAEDYEPYEEQFEGEILDSADLEAIREGKMELQLFIEWDEADKVKSFSYYYLEDGNLFNYRRFEDGTSRNQILN